jgi:hypothetical protein
MFHPEVGSQDYCQNLAPVVEEGYGTLYSAVRGPRGTRGRRRVVTELVEAPRGVGSMDDGGWFLSKIMTNWVSVLGGSSHGS